MDCFLKDSDYAKYFALLQPEECNDSNGLDSNRYLKRRCLRSDDFETNSSSCGGKKSKNFDTDPHTKDFSMVIVKYEENRPSCKIGSKTEINVLSHKKYIEDPDYQKFLKHLKVHDNSYILKMENGRDGIAKYEENRPSCKIGSKVEINELSHKKYLEDPNYQKFLKHLEVHDNSYILKMEDGRDGIVNYEKGSRLSCEIRSVTERTAQDDIPSKGGNVCADRHNQEIIPPGPTNENVKLDHKSGKKNVEDPDYRIFLKYLENGILKYEENRASCKIGSKTEINELSHKKYLEDPDYQKFLKHLEVNDNSYILKMEDGRDGIVKYEKGRRLSCEIRFVTQRTAQDVIPSKGGNVCADRHNQEIIPPVPTNENAKLDHKSNKKNVEDPDYRIFLKYLEIHNDSYNLKMDNLIGGKPISVRDEEKNVSQMDCRGRTPVRSSSRLSDRTLSQRTDGKKVQPLVLNSGNGEDGNLVNVWHDQKNISWPNLRMRIQSVRSAKGRKTLNSVQNKEKILCTDTKSEGYFPSDCQVTTAVSCSARLNDRNLSQRTDRKIQPLVPDSGNGEDENVANVRHDQKNMPWLNLRMKTRSIGATEDGVKDNLCLAKSWTSSEGSPTKSILCCNKLKVGEADDISIISSFDNSNNFKKNLTEVLEKPFDLTEYNKLRSEACGRNPIKQARNTRNGCKVYDTERLGQSYLGYYSELEEKIKLAGGDRHVELKLLRGFFFWLKNICHPGAYSPWCHFTDSKCIILDS